MFFGGSPFEQFAGMHGGDGGGGGGRRGGPPADVDTTELYQILGIEKDATENDIKKAYRKLALKVCLSAKEGLRQQRRPVRSLQSLENFLSLLGGVA